MFTYSALAISFKMLKNQKWQLTALPQTPIADAGGGHPLPHLPPSAQAPRSSRLRCSLGITTDAANSS